MWFPRWFKRLEELLRTELRAIQQALTDQAVAARGANADTQARENKERPLRVAAFRVQRHEAKEASRYRKWGHCQQVILNVLTLLAVIGAWLYAAITYVSLQELRTQTKIQREVAQSSQRAWVGLDGPIVADVLQPNPLKIGGHYAIKNFGSGPAIKVSAIAWPVWDTEKLDYLNVGRLACTGPLEEVTGTIPHGPKMVSPGPMGFVLFPTQTHTEEVGGGIWTGPAVSSIRHIWFAGCVAYLDQFNAVHWTRFCMESSYLARPPLTKGTPLQFCALFNDTDDNRAKD